MMAKNNGETTKMTCGGCVRFKKRGRNKEGWHCACQDWNIEVHPDDNACEYYWDLQEKKEQERQERMREEQERQELWKRNKNNPPMLPMLEFDCDGLPGDEACVCPICPTCGDVLYETEEPDGISRCYFCGQKILQKDQIDMKSVINTENCSRCGGIGTLEYRASGYANRKSGLCTKCGLRVI